MVDSLVRPFAPDRLAGLVFLSNDRFCLFRADCGLEFNSALDEKKAYAVIDPDSGQFIGVQHPGYFVGSYDPAAFKIFLLRPLLES